MTTPLQAEASRRNGALSNGPLTSPGKASSRSNALTHGLSGAGVVLHPEEAEEVARREAQWLAVFRPTHAIEAFHVRQYAIESVRIERCQELERNLLQLSMERASDETVWHEDRALEAEELGARLARDPARATRRLRQTLQGCDWLIQRWEGLARSLDSGPWDEPRRNLALDLLGTPDELRNGPTVVDLAEGPDPTAPQRALATGQIAELHGLRDRVLLPRDQGERQMARLGVDAVDGPIRRQLRLVRRYESESQGRLRHSLRLILEGRLMPGAPAIPEEVSDLPIARPEARPALEAVAAASATAEAEAPSRNEPARPEPRPSKAEPRSASEPPASPSPVQEPLPRATEGPRGNRRWRKQQARRQRAARA